MKKPDEDEWRKKLTPGQYHVLREKGTEPPFTGRLLYNDKAGTYACAACGNVIFDSNTKFDSKVGGLVFTMHGRVQSNSAKIVRPGRSAPK